MNNTLHITPSLEELPKLFDFLSPWQVPDTLMLGVEEAVVNAISYSGASGIDVTCRREGDSLTVEIADDGAPFDPTAYTPKVQIGASSNPTACPETPEIGSPEIGSVEIGSLEVGGHGIRLIRALCDAVAYKRKGERNVLALTKHLSE